MSKLSNFYYKAIVRMYEILSVIMEDKVRLSLVWGCVRAND
ncbi:phosphoesterase [Bacillus cereus]|nr:phosphoesterase [Bacillus cereus]PFN33852.1 phosphoesterase [Bacillus cereus]PNU10850.1 phosphoesterase [Bacillus cereus]QHH87411.1 phosphoesterase [Bacillus paranthracis]